MPPFEPPRVLISFCRLISPNLPSNAHHQIYLFGSAQRISSLQICTEQPRTRSCSTQVGNSTQPFQENGVIKLRGLETDPVIVLMEGLYMHNKVLYYTWPAAN